ncbi:MAG: hypothetical protein JWM12_2089 [Ilumatobacteraceae bacterium]|nr:hypothetical protein [Ilumatobacteraceae bacterium]
MRTWIVRAAVIGAGAVLGVGGVAAAAPAGVRTAADGSSTTASTAAAAPVVAAEGTVTLPLFGAPLTIDIATDPSGSLASVSVNPADGWTAAQDRPNRVAFVNADGTAKVRVATRHGGEVVSAKGTTLADITGPGQWKGDVFGTGTPTTVAFEVVAAADGSPDITGVTSSDASAVIGGTQHHTGSGGGFARASVTFTAAGQKRVLSISVAVDSSGDHANARLSVSLSGTRGVPQAAADAAGARAWQGMLCDGTAGSINYTVGADGTITDVTAIPAGAEVKTDGNQTEVRFATGERVDIKVRAHDGQLTVKVDKSFHCDSPDPSVNTPISTTPGTTDDHGHDRGDDQGGRGGRGDGRDATTTTVAGAATATTVAGTATTVSTTDAAGSRDGSSRDGRGNG